MSNEVTNFKDWLIDVLCDGDIDQHAAAKEIWINIPDNSQDYRTLNLRFATIYNGMFHDIFIELWNLYSDHQDYVRSVRRG